MAPRKAKRPTLATDSSVTASDEAQERLQLNNQKLDFSAANQVLETAELLEMILLPLDMYQLFVIQRTSSFFRGVIEGSIELRRKMWLELMSDEDADRAALDTPPINTIDHHGTDYFSVSHGEPEAGRFYVNPLLLSSVFVPKTMVKEDRQYGLALDYLIRLENVETLRLAIRSYDSFDTPAQSNLFYPTQPFHRIPLHEAGTVEPSWCRMLALKLKTEHLEIISLYSLPDFKVAGQDRPTLGEAMDQIGDAFDKACMAHFTGRELMELAPPTDSSDDDKYQKVGLNKFGITYLPQINTERQREITGSSSGYD